MLHSIPYPNPTYTFLQIIHGRIASIVKDISLIKQTLIVKREEKKSLTLISLKIQRANFKSKVKKIPAGHSSKTKKVFNPKSKTVLSPEDMIAAMTPADRLNMVQMLTKQNVDTITL